MNPRKIKQNRYKAKRKAKLSLQKVRRLASSQIRDIAYGLGNGYFHGVCYFVDAYERYRNAYNLMTLSAWPAKDRRYAGIWWLGSGLLGDGSFVNTFVEMCAWPDEQSSERAYMRRTIGLLLASEFVKDLPLKAFREAGYNC